MALSPEGQHLSATIHRPEVRRFPGLHSDLLDALERWVHRVEGEGPSAPDAAPAPTETTPGIRDRIEGAGERWVEGVEKALGHADPAADAAPEASKEASDEPRTDE